MKLFNKLPKRILAAVVTFVAVAGVSAAAVAGFGPDRPTKVYSDGVAGFDYPVFNSFTNVPGYGDERNFLTGAYPGGGALTDPLAQVKQDDELTLQILVHNNADPKYNADGSGFAKDTKVRVELPSGMSKSHQAKAYISASNTNPLEIYDTLDFGALNGGFFELEYVPGSARVRGNYIDTAVSDAIVGSGVMVGTRSLNGVVEGCFGEEVLVTLKVKVKMPHYTLVKEVRKASEATTAYATSKDVAIGDELVWKVIFKNIGRTTLEDVKFIDPIPENMTVIPGSIKVYNQQNPNGYSVPDTAIQANGRQIEIGLGDYQAGNPADDADPNKADAYIYFRTKVDRNTSTLCGDVVNKNTAYVQPAGLIAISNDASATIKTGKSCVTDQPSYVCKDLKVEKLGGRKVRASVVYEGTPANRVAFKNIEFNFGDGSTPLVTTTNPVEYTYAKDGTYKVSAKVTFTVDGVNQTVGGAVCEEVVTFGTPPTTIPNTGAGSMIGVFLATSLVSLFAYRAYTARKF